MMPTPFVLNDAVLIHQKIQKYIAPVNTLTPANTVTDSTAVVKDSLQPVVKPE